MDPNKRLAELLGIEWHTETRAFDGFAKAECSCGLRFEDNWELTEHLRNNPDFFTDAGKVELMRLMEKREDWLDFRDSSLCIFDDFVPVDFITEKETGLLAIKCRDWLRKEKTNGKL
jgi:hypothetical protein